MAMARRAAACLFLGLASAEPAARTSLRKRANTEVTVSDVEKSLVTEIAGQASSERLRELEVALQPMYDSLPKEESGQLGHQAVRYALHRLLLQRHGWFVVGLEPTDKALPPYLHSEWVPQYLQGLLEQRLGDRGLDLSEMAALAAALEDLVKKEANQRLDMVLGFLGYSPGAVLTDRDADRVLETYMMMYLDGGNFTTWEGDVDAELASFKVAYGDWDSAMNWIRRSKKARNGHFDHQALSGVVGSLGDEFSTFNQGECRSMKQELMRMEGGSRPGRIALKDFYKKGLYSHWDFNERADYLRVLGALDEFDAAEPAVIVANYLGSRPNCLAASKLYAVCCRNECEDLMGQLERKIAAPSAPADEVLRLVAGMASDTVNASRALPDGLVQRLHSIAERHGGQVPLHGRLFAQWMHHAYPHECPYPHESGVNPQTPDEWMREAGGEEEGVQGSKASEAEVREILGDCARNKDGRCSEAADHSKELPWSESEVLLSKAPAGAAGERPSLALLLVKAALLAVVAALVATNAGGPLKKMGSRERRARNLDFADWDDIDEDLKKPTAGAPAWQKALGLVLMLLVCGCLELAGILDRFSFYCTLLLGLVLNFGLPLALSKASPKAAKQCL